jgi:hypothetical protein
MMLKVLWTEYVMLVSLLCWQSEMMFTIISVVYLVQDLFCDLLLLKLAEDNPWDVATFDIYASISTIFKIGLFESPTIQTKLDNM